MADIQAYRDSHFSGVKTLWEEAFPNDSPWNRAEIAIKQKLAVQPDLFLVAVDGGEVIGTIMAGYDGHRGWLNYVAVGASRRGSGIGTALVEAAETRLREIGCTKINLQVRVANRAVARFYEHIGYAFDDVLSMGKRVAG
jgi:ribosomal protein S18 acetylase RimI-like enzyme